MMPNYAKIIHSLLPSKNKRATSGVDKVGKPKSASSNAVGESKPISEVVDIVKRVSAGDFEARIIDINPSDENVELLHEINELIDRCDAYIRESVACLDYVNQNQFYRKIIETSMQGSFLTASRSANAALDFMREKQDGFAKVANDFEHTVGSFVSTVASASTQLSASSKGMRMMADDSNAKAINVTTAAKETFSDLQTMTVAVDDLTTSATEIGKDIKNAVNAANEAKLEIDTAGNSVNSLGEVVGHAESALEMIHQISFQTKMLALNAKIEASRAGDAGMGFAVVADEIKSLSDRSTQVTAEVEDHIINIKEEMQNTINDMAGVLTKVSEITSANSSISEAMIEQVNATNEISQKIDQASNATKKVTRNIEDVRSATAETGNSAMEVDAAALDLSAQTDTLIEVVDKFLYSARKAAA